MALKDVGPFLVQLAAGLGQQFNDALEKAYQKGVEDGRRIAAEELSAKVASVLQIATPQKTFLGSIGDEERPAEGASRAPKGTVEPAVLDALQGAVRGKKPAEIAAEKGIPENSARGMLNKLRQAGKVEKRGELWFLANKGGWTSQPPQSSGAASAG